MQHLRAPTHNIHAGTQALMRQGLPRRKPRDALPQHGPQLRRHILRLTTRRRDHQHRRALGNRRHRPRARLRDPRDVKIRLTDVREQTRQFRVCSCGFQQTRKHRCSGVFGGVRGILGGHLTNNIRWVRHALLWAVNWSFEPCHCYFSRRFSTSLIPRLARHHHRHLG